MIVLTWILNALYDSMTFYFWVMQGGLMFCSTCIPYWYYIYFCANLLYWSDGMIYFCSFLLDSWLFSDLLLFCILCGQCRQKTTDHMAQCKSNGMKPCTQNFCAKCLLNRYVCVLKSFSSPFVLLICMLPCEIVFFNLFSFSIGLFARRTLLFLLLILLLDQCVYLHP